MNGPTSLTPAQASAVNTISGPLLVLAGPGSGKTRVITRRIAHMLDQGIPASRILAITFTNKAAREMAERVSQLAPRERVWISTFHRFCSFLLRRCGSGVGLAPNFSILDSSDQRSVIRQACHELDIDGKHFPPARIAGQISRAKNDMLSPDDFLNLQAERIGDHFQSLVARIYPEYQRLLLASNSVDFDDLLLLTIQLLRENPELRRQLDERYEYVLVDEYQDTNRAQYEIVKALASDFRNLCATGDPDQSIYGWRGAKIENILRFEQDYPEAQIVRLEENFRSTSQILDVADELIRNNRNRKHKELVTSNPDGPPVRLETFEDARHEAEMIAEQIRGDVERGLRKWSEFAIFYRVNSISRQLEIALSRARVPYQVAAGLAFYDRIEIKDLVCYLRLINNPRDNVAFLRVINTPARGIGKTTLQRMQNWCERNRTDLLTAAHDADQIPGLTARARKALKQFSDQFDQWVAAAGREVGELLQQVLVDTGYLDGWSNSNDERAEQRIGNINELISAARNFDRTDDAEEADGSPLERFLETCSLAGETDQLDGSSGQVTLMTLHAAKGLEFPAVFIVGVEQNLIPHERTIRSGDPHELEEERRLLFVGITRAMEELVLTQCLVREQHGRPLHTIPSEFLEEISLRSTLTSSPLIAARTGRQPERAADEFEFTSDDARFADDQSSERDRRRRKPNVPAALKLMRGSDLLSSTMGTGESQRAGELTLPQGFALGMQVRHPRYGRGVVTRLGGMSKHRTVTVAFEADGREETFVASKCPLQPIAKG